MTRSTVDLRSDTVTRPTKAMRQAMADAEVGDDVYGEDPTVRPLDERVAELLGKEAALFVPSGTMANQIAVGLHTRPGDELLCDATSHVYVWEGGGIARLWGVTTRAVEPRKGLVSRIDLENLIRPDDPHYVRTRMVSLENTHNRRGGAVQRPEAVTEIARWTRLHGLALHCDGARLMNAAVALDLPAATLAARFDTVSICFSKGLGAPVGSALAGSATAMREARRLRKVLGGGMRQAGVIAAAALHALDHHVERLRDDHANAQILAEAVAACPGLRLEVEPVETNLVWFRVDPALGTAGDVAARLRADGIFISALGPDILRACTHLDITRADAEAAAAAIRRLKGSRTSVASGEHDRWALSLEGD
jgi:threonine aldolase